jgi:hypothetical protein
MVASPRPVKTFVSWTSNVVLGRRYSEDVRESAINFLLAICVGQEAIIIQAIQVYVHCQRKTVIADSRGDVVRKYQLAIVKMIYFKAIWAS